ncbi:MAG: endolytic transglycosylase MltG [Hyphomicrobiales bacterium]|nr:endolytic transglycosylase MltG [Hyphomicrobiales bacterium]
MTDELPDDRTPASAPANDLADNEISPTPAAPAAGSSKRLFGSRKLLKSPKEALQPDLVPPPPPRPKRRRRSLSSQVSGFVTFGAALFLLVGFFVGEAKKQLEMPGPLTKNTVVMIPRGTDTPGIVNVLLQNGVIRDDFWMQVALFLKGQRGRLKAGEYQFTASETLASVMSTIIAGKSIEHSLTIPEGWSVEQVVERLDADPLLTGTISQLPPEGSLLPSTYKYLRGDTRGHLIAVMTADDRKLLAQIWAGRDPTLPLKTPEQLVTLASIVEKETGKIDERPRVAAVFLNRLQRRMPLQSDPTVIYGLVGGKAALGHQLTKADLQTPSPYNTYLHYGLPPGPIGNPGKAALEAVAHPDHTKELYFVADGSGGHVFADTLKQHNINVAHWRALQKLKDAASPGAAPAATPDAVPAAAPLADPKLRQQHSELLPDQQDFSRSLAAQRSALAAATPLARDLRARALRLATALQFNYGVGIGLAQQDATAAPAQAKASATDAALDAGLPGADLTNFHPVRPSATERSALAAINRHMPMAKGPKGRAVVRRALAYDASEGTSYDPLREHGYDLNATQNVPALKAP